MHFARLTLLLPILSLFSCAGAKAATLAGEIERATLAYLHAQSQHNETLAGRLEIKVSPLDSRLKLPDCGTPLEFEHKPLRAGRQSLRVRCGQPQNWSIFVSAQIRHFKPVLISSQALPKGTQLTASNTQLAERETSRLRHGYYTSLEQAQGYELKRSIGAQSPLTPGMLRPPLVIRRDDRLTIQAGGDSLNVRMTGTALEDGRQGEQIRVRNDRSGRTVRARVISPGLVQAGP